MLKRLKARRGRVWIICAVIIVGGICVLPWVEKYFPLVEHVTYYDFNNGVRRVQWKSFGFVWRQVDTDTPYHQILKDCGFSQEEPDWENVAEWRGISSCSVICRRAGEDYAIVRAFELLWRSYGLDPAQARGDVARFRELLRGKDRQVMDQFLESLSVQQDALEENKVVE